MKRARLQHLRAQVAELQRVAHESPEEMGADLPRILADLQRSLERPVDGDAPPAPNGDETRPSVPARLERLRAAAERAPLLVRAMGRGANCRWANPSWTAFTGRSQERVLGDGWLRDVHADDRARCADSDDAASVEPNFIELEYRLRRASGGFAWVHEHRVPRLLARGGCAGYLATAVNVSPRKRAELQRDLLSAAEHKQAKHAAAHYLARVQSLMGDLLVAEERERKRLAVDLHDGLSQTIALAQMKLSALRASQPAAVDGALGEVQGLLDQADLAARSVGFELSPLVLHDLGLEPALQWLIDNIHDRYGVAVELQCEGRIPSLDEATRVTLFRATRELLINASKHAEAEHVTVLLKRRRGRLHIVVADDGVGMQPSTGLSEGFGLLSIRDRMGHIGGRMIIESKCGKGTTVRLSTPLGAGHSRDSETEK